MKVTFKGSQKEARSLFDLTQYTKQGTLRKRAPGAGRPTIPLEDVKCHNVHGLLDHQQWLKWQRACGEAGCTHDGLFLRYIVDNILS